MKEQTPVVTVRELGLRNDVNLCHSCTHYYATCDGNNIILGSGIGNDNVCACSEYAPQYDGWKNE